MTQQNSVMRVAVDEPRRVTAGARLLRRLVVILVIVGSVPVASAEPVEPAKLLISSFAHEKKGDLSRALNDVLKLLRSDPTHYLANLRAGWLYYQKGRYSDSVTFYKKAVAGAGRALEPQLGLMLPLMAAGRWGDAEVLGRRILTQAPRNYLAASRLAWILYQQGRYNEAVTQYQAVLADFPSDADMRVGLGWAWLRAGRPDYARAQFAQVLAIYPENKSARTALAGL